MERHRSGSTDHPNGRHELRSNRNGHESPGTPSVDAGADVVRIPGLSSGGEVCAETSARKSVDPCECLPSETLRDQLQDIRRRLWILNATLESLPAKLEQA
jgi:hypothetical protein